MSSQSSPCSLQKHISSALYGSLSSEVAKKFSPLLAFLNSSVAISVLWGSPSTEFWNQCPFLWLLFNFFLVIFQWFLMEVGACRGRQCQLIQSNAQLSTVSCGFLCLAFTSVIKSLMFMSPPKNTYLFNNLRHLHSAYSDLGGHLFYVLERAGS